MKIEKIIPTCVKFEDLKIGDCFMLSCDTDASVFLKVDGGNSRKNAVNLTTSVLIEVSSNVIVFPIDATLTVEL